MTKEECEIETSKAIMEMKSHIEKLEKENAELDCQRNRNKYCYSCANATERCFKNEIGCPCQKYKSYTEENTELKKRNGELAEQRASLERWFGEAKAIIKNVIRVTWGEGWNYSLDVKVKAEQFLKEIEK